ncbi:MAG: hypothetical protein HYR63_08795 [Proteobacteria bacterium]|nr:hypothetical protein [Pseudomonadota bacterium]
MRFAVVKVEIPPEPGAGLAARIATDQQAPIVMATRDKITFDRFDRIFRLRDGRLMSTAGNPAADPAPKTAASAVQSV